MYILWESFVSGEDKNSWEINLAKIFHAYLRSLQIVLPSKDIFEVERHKFLEKYVNCRFLLDWVSQGTKKLSKTGEIIKYFYDFMEWQDKLI